MEVVIETQDLDRPLFCPTHGVAPPPNSHPNWVDRSQSRLRFGGTVLSNFYSLVVNHKTDQLRDDYRRLVRGGVRVLPELVVQAWCVNPTNYYEATHPDILSVHPTESGEVLEFRHDGPGHYTLTACESADPSRLHSGGTSPQASRTAELLAASAVGFALRKYIGRQVFPSCSCSVPGIGPRELMQPRNNIYPSRSTGKDEGYIYNFDQHPDPSAWAMMEVEPGWWMMSS